MSKPRPNHIEIVSPCTESDIVRLAIYAAIVGSDENHCCRKISLPSLGERLSHQRGTQLVFSWIGPS
ncbi:hypothetical protein GGQ79_003776 [Ochrobactrum pecoris]|uniref:Uncharacterized protein n=1 Tax=Brucella pecoris TaxID=867683 RepID=A0AB34YVC9_9HYPH|nr:hypothetical protein [Brucella pecoris]